MNAYNQEIRYRVKKALRIFTIFTGVLALFYLLISIAEKYGTRSKL